MTMTSHFLRAFCALAIANCLLSFNSSIVGQDTYVRAVDGTSGTTTWGDDDWVSDVGFLPNPSATDDAVIGDSTLPPSIFSSAGEVILDFGSTNQSIRNLTLGTTVNTTDFGTLNMSTGGNLTAELITMYNLSSVNLSSGTLDADNVMITDNAALTVTGTGSLAATTEVTLDGPNASLDLNGLTTVAELNLINGATYVIAPNDVTDGDVSLTSNSNLIFSQGPGDTTGITLDSLFIDTGSTFTLNYDAGTVIDGTATPPGDWALRLTGDQTALLDDYIQNGLLVGNLSNPNFTNIVARFDGTDTFVLAIPEPGTTGFLILTGLLLFGRTRRKVA